MCNSNHFDKNKMLNWEKKSTAVKSNYTNAKTYFEDLVKATDTYKQNAGGGTTSHNKYKSANQRADCGNEIRNYIAKIASAAAANSDHAANTHATNTQFEATLAQIKALTDAVAKLTAKKSSAEQNSKNVNPNTRGKNRGNSGRTASQHGRLLSLPRLPPSWPQSQQQDMHPQTGLPQGRRYLDQQNGG
jgi:hypothetical protein